MTEESNKTIQRIKLEMAAKRKELHELEVALKEGRKVGADIDACKGYLEVLKKELKSVDDSGHTTFLATKKVISPKFKVDSKKQEILKRLRETNQAIEIHQAKIDGGGLDDAELGKVSLRIETLVQAREEAKVELKSLKQYNHTRFLDMKRIAQDSLTEEEKKNLELREKTLKQSLREARVFSKSPSSQVIDPGSDESTEEPTQQPEELFEKKSPSSDTKPKFETKEDDFEPPVMI